MGRLTIWAAGDDLADAGLVAVHHRGGRNDFDLGRAGREVEGDSEIDDLADLDGDGLGFIFGEAIAGYDYAIRVGGDEGHD